MAYCRQKDISESQLTEFQREYRHKSPIWWYSCETFLYSTLNKALALLDVETMAKLGFFIRHLHRQLQQMHKKQSSAFKKEFVVYRGRGVTKANIDHLVSTKGGLLSFNNFLSTSKELNVSMEFIQRNLMKHKDNLGVLFVMTINPSKLSRLSTLYALIDEYSAIPSEQEILFSMHTVFRVEEVSQFADNERLYKVHLTLTDENDPQLLVLTQYMRKEIKGFGWHRLGQLMLKVGHFRQAEEYYNRLLKNAINRRDEAVYLNMLGRAKHYQGQYETAVSYYEKSLELGRQYFGEYHSELATYHNNIGLLYDNIGVYTKALEHYEKSCKIYEKTVSSDDPSLATAYGNIGSTYMNSGQYSKALESYEKSRELLEKILPSNHPALATCFNNTGLLFVHMGKYSKALEYYDKANRIYQIALPSKLDHFYKHIYEEKLSQMHHPRGS